MAFELPALPYPIDALAPHLSKETLEFHHGKHHATYVAKLNDAIKGSALEKKTLEELVKSEKGPNFNNSAQIWNHTFYWNSMKPKGGGEPKGKVADALKSAFGDFAKFKDEFSKACAGHFGSGWAWLVKGKDGKLAIAQTHDAGCPITDGVTPLLTCDVWEHAYYIDYRNARPKYVEAWWNLVNWDWAAKQLG